MIANDVIKAWSARGHVVLGIVALVVLIGGFGTWSVTTQLASAIVAPGAIEVEQSRQVVQHPDGGVVASVEVTEGDVVESGQILIRLDPERLQSELTIVESQLFELLARRGRLEAERDNAERVSFAPLLHEQSAHNADVAMMMENNRALFQQRRDNAASSVTQLERRKSQILNQIDGISAQQTAVESQLELIGEELASQKTLLEKGLTQASRVLALQREMARLQGTVGELTATRAQNEERITEIEIEILKTGTQSREEAIARLSDQEGRELELIERRRAIVEQLDRLDIRAPVAGAVHALQVFGERSVVRPADPVLYLVPRDRPLVIGVQVDTIHIDRIAVSQTVTLRFSALDTRRSPEILGRVVSISPDALHDERSGRSFYRARIVIEDGELEKLPEGTELVPGMPVEAYLRTGDQSPLAYLVKPLADYFNTAFREE